MRFEAVLSLAVLGWLPLYGAATVRVVDLRCEYRKNPLGIDDLQPRLSWRLEGLSATARNLKQSAYQVIVATTESGAVAGRGDLWDTGRIAGDQSIQVVYGGKPLTSTLRFYWRVKVWDQDGQASSWSENAVASMGLLHTEEWRAKWIGKEEAGDQQDPASPYWALKQASWIEPASAPADGTDASDVFFRANFDVPAGRTVVDALALSYATKVTGPLVTKKGKLGPLFPVDENPYDLFLN